MTEQRQPEDLSIIFLILTRIFCDISALGCAAFPEQLNARLHGAMFF
ncbi:MAG: hypothetical protein IJS28_04470 [Synergistaceae bacterium]|nr:hypothetical protein [Synergistaceae bacterium]